MECKVKKSCSQNPIIYGLVNTGTDSKCQQIRAVLFKSPWFNGLSNAKYFCRLSRQKLNSVTDTFRFCVPCPDLVTKRKKKRSWSRHKVLYLHRCRDKKMLCNKKDWTAWPAVPVVAFRICTGEVKVTSMLVEKVCDAFCASAVVSLFGV